MSQPLSLQEVLHRGVEQILPSSAGLAAQMEQRKIRLYLGIDPTGNQLHLGHAVALRKLQQLADLGHDVILLIGNGTVKIGDPTGRDKTRPMLTDEVIEENFQTWKDQASKILDFSKIEIRRNGDWFDKMSFSDLIQLFSQMTVQQLMERDMFQERLNNNLPIYAHEILYPILQGYDSVVMDVDLEIGGNDQLFNMMVGRQMQMQMNSREKYVLAVPLLIGTDGRKMGKSLGNFISLTETPEDMYGKVMSVVDDVIISYFELLTNVPQAEIDTMREQLALGTNPIDIKKRLAFTLTEQMHSTEDAQKAQEHFERTVQNREVPAEMPELKVGQAEISLLDLIMLTGVPNSKSEARRLIEQGGVEVSGVKKNDGFLQIDVTLGIVLKVGKRQYWRAIL